jgi:hypothetical protein
VPWSVLHLTEVLRRRSSESTSPLELRVPRPLVPSNSVLRGLNWSGLADDRSLAHGSRNQGDFNGLDVSLGGRNIACELPGSYLCMSYYEVTPVCQRELGRNNRWDRPQPHRNRIATMNT